MGRDCAANDRIPMSVSAHFGILFYKRAHEVSARFTAPVVRIAARERGFRSCLIAATASRQKDDRRQQVVAFERREQSCRRHFGHAQFHNFD
jgi:hypothetical protein